ncbi:hypothetical protein TPHA_0B02900 [Tetrapisispora phaffii CBS 4417]|uniref:Trafficking protein particle complex subunit n=1 Tax=Tetrapisispora phaffii (strain ATCC 24235 / CBS 4417 / NBRC 1672 / NRRL Y-8282 / UCD 70-5) TaxID=1071381 RepID=G8BPN1_TETPH|nr:hypothetical protein TPHA_0B02900 [Tetrapisispora phaffii CBS 4417]CCE61962.1 hypothetical protein TPHA_0B02900 [Tetrapisispora phaffii CBS 4417]
MSTPPIQTGQVLTSQQKAQQFKLFEDSLPKVNQLAFQLLLNEVVPLSMAVEEKVFDDKIQVNESEDQTNQKAEDVDNSDASNITKDIEDKLHITPELDLPSHVLIHQISTTNAEKREGVIKRLQSIGFNIGSKLTELLVFKNNPNIRFKDAEVLLIMKFICRDVWKQIYGKQIDNLKTNHRGTFYLFDYDYRPIRNFVVDGDISDPSLLEKETSLAQPFLEIPIGIITGVLSSLGFKSEVVACKASFVDKPDGTSKLNFPKGVSFHIQIVNQ